MTTHLHNNDLPSDKERELFDRLEVPYNTTREEVWDTISKQLHDVPPTKRTIRTGSYRLIPLAAAAALTLLIGITLFARFYSETVYCPNGRHLSFRLPDGSVTELNAQSTLSYNPYWWTFSRKVRFEGEGFFKVKKGKSFEVVSPMGKTVVLGTSFNIYARGESYKVSCITGTVKVISDTDNEVILNMYEKAIIDASGSIEKEENIKREQETAWTRQIVNFTSAPFMEVIAEVERQYDVTITTKRELDYSYTGFFSKKKQVSEVLDLLCKPFGLTFVQHSKSHYEIIKN